MAECCAADKIKDITIVLKREEQQDFGFHILGGKDAPYLPYDNGIYVSKIISDSVADRAGNLAPGDKILSTALSEHFESSTSDSDVSDHSTLSEFDDDADDFMNNDYSIILKKLQCLEDENSSDRFYTKIGRCFKKFPAKQFLFFGLSVVFLTILVRYRNCYR
ncbi:Synaptojanin-2-binding protein [Trichinella murrelli]|uniref:Synaptojanin-2-binding protein n=1 Tax=Trichinella murrelli TaxID=144512 RepID=A0A0V0U2K2_9BILA|nr:Synaptojanin-2-binding protein [Trichinella murrelli]